MASGDLDTNSGFDGHPRGMDEIEDILKRHLSWIQSYVHRVRGKRLLSRHRASVCSEPVVLIA